MGERNLQEQGKNGWRGSGRRGEGTLGHGQKEEKEGRGKGKKERMNQIATVPMSCPGNFLKELSNV